MTLYSDDGVEIRFGSSDIKALLTYFQGEVVRTPAPVAFRSGQ